MQSERLKATLRKVEAERLKPYPDQFGKITIGVGRNLTDNGIRKSEMEFLLENDVTEAFQGAATLPGWQDLSDVRQRALCEMVFQLGIGTVRTFTRMIAALVAGDPGQVADEMLDSAWATQTPGRAHRVAQMMRTGQDPA